jgi:sugar lactone lactonase YvrE
MLNPRATRLSRRLSAGLLAIGAGLILSLTPTTVRGQPVTTAYFSSNNDDVNRYTPPGPVANVANLSAVSPNLEGLAFDTAGNLFVAGGGDVAKITPGGAATHFATLPTGAGGYGMAIDSGNNLYVANASLNQISKITPGGAVSVFATIPGSFNPTGLTFDTSGTLYACTGNTIKAITPGGAVSTYATLTGYVNTYGLAFDSFGYLYVSDLTSTALLKVAPGGGSFTTFGSLSSGPKGLAFDRNGVLFAAQPGEDNISTVASNGTATTFGAGLNNPRYLAFNTGPIVATHVANLATAIPGGTGNFTSFPKTPSLSGDNVAFLGTGSLGAQGVYARIGAISPPQLVADTNTAIPNGIGNFTSFPSAPSISSDSVAFIGTGTGVAQGVYAKIGAISPPQRIADTSTAIPGGTGNFTSFIPVDPIAPAISGSNVAFFGAGSGGQLGIYAKYGAISPPQVVADTNTAIPSGTGNFTSFPSAPSISSDSIAFVGAGSGVAQGVYAKIGAISPPQRIADTNTAIPGGTGNFTSFIPQEPTAPAISGDAIAFWGAGAGGAQGIYATHGAISPPQRVADTSTAIPGGTGLFLSFADVSISATDTAFLGFGANGQQGIYDLNGGTLTKVVDLNDTIDGRAITGLRLSATGLSGDPIAFQATFADGSEGIYFASVPEPGTLLLSGCAAMTAACARRRWKRAERDHSSF